MDELFLVRVLTTAINAMKAPSRRIYNRLFAPREHLEPSDLLQFDIITGSEKILGNISIYAPATVTDKTGRKTVTMTAPRLSSKRFIATAALNSLRAMGGKISVEMMKDRIAREQKDMRNEHDRTLEFWAANALKGKIYDKDLSTVLVDYGMAGTHQPTLTGDDLWTSTASDPIAKIRELKLLIEDDASVAITGWLAYLGYEAMDALLAHAAVRDLLKTDKGSQMAENGRIQKLVEVELEEYNGSFIDDTGTRRRFINSDEFLLIGLCEDMVDTPYAPVVDDEAPGGVGNVDANGNGALFFSKSWPEKDPSGRWVKAEARPLPVLQRPAAVVDATVV
ncbi:MAG: major capsid protein [Candidatus Marinimicrobia bacterium]|nr:major capsid protein [Candidatus Neomarinimicrobiota bacterium]